jgi:HEAT repeat protein
MLVAQALRQYRPAMLLQFLEDGDAIVRSAAARELQLRPSRGVFGRARRLLANDQSISREVGAFILGQLGTPSRPYLRASVPLLLKLIQSESDAQVRGVALSSLGHLKAKAAIGRLTALHTDPSPFVRANLAIAIGSAYARSATKMPRQLLRALEALRSDRSRRVRDAVKLAFELLQNGKQYPRKRDTRS